MTLLAWGSSFGPVREAMEMLNRDNPNGANMIHFQALWPFPTDTAELLSRARRLIAVEGNWSGQFARSVRGETGIGVDGLITRYDGLPLSPSYILEELERVRGRERVA